MINESGLLSCGLDRRMQIRPLRKWAKMHNSTVPSGCVKSCALP